MPRIKQYDKAIIDMNSWIADKAVEHIWHTLSAVKYGDVNVAIECLPCGVVVWDNGL